MDPLSESLDVFELTLTSSTRFEAAGPWGLSFDRHDHIKVGAVLAGTCLIAVAGGEPARLDAGDCWLLAGGHAFSVASGPDVTPLPQATALPSPWASTVHYAPAAEPAAGAAGLAGADPARGAGGGGPGQRTVIVSSSLTLSSDATGLLLGALPPLTLISSADPGAAAVGSVLGLLNGESAVDRPGGTAMRRHLSHVLFLHALRVAYAKPGAAGGRGWLAALSDPLIGRALRAVHDDPARKWTVAELAGQARMSRSLFAERFHREVGLPPAEYAARWRVHVVAHQLRTTDRRIAEIATDLGFSSPSALSTAFTRQAGRSPARYRSPHRGQESGRGPRPEAL
jgi:AraC-like DNA-binding protein